MDVPKTEATWTPLLEQSMEIIAAKTANTMYVAEGTDLYRKIAEAVPWQIRNIQIAHLPKAKRIKPGLEECHRCSVLQFNDGGIAVEAEYLPDCQAPRERFARPVKIAIFIMGIAPGEPKEPSPAQPAPKHPTCA